MSSNASLYEVQGPRGTTMYAVHDRSTGMVWTERTEQAAQSLAREKHLEIDFEGTITRTELLRLMGQEPEEAEPFPTPPPASQATQTPPTKPSAPTWLSPQPAHGVPPVKITETVEADDAIVARADASKPGIFCSKGKPTGHFSTSSQVPFEALIDEESDTISGRATFPPNPPSRPKKDE